MQNIITVVTTIQKPTDSIEQLAAVLRAAGSTLLVIGDKKGPVNFELDGAEFVSLTEQLQLPFKLAKLLPTGHYSRKNIGYLIAQHRGASCIYETDDDNAPAAHWRIHNARVQTHKAKTNNTTGWYNVFKLFSKTDDIIWPRGFPLDCLRASLGKPFEIDEKTIEIEAPIQQGLVNNSPDVDALWRLLFDRKFNFNSNNISISTNNTNIGVFLDRNMWCPFNSQNTWWWPVAYPLMYLPSFCSFRMTDIWRSFIAQRCLWEIGSGLFFHEPDVIQQRNEHNLMQDFQDEIPGYMGNSKLCNILEQIQLHSGIAAVADNLITCYTELVQAGFFPDKELALVKAWVDDIKN